GAPGHPDDEDRPVSDAIAEGASGERQERVAQNVANDHPAHRGRGHPEGRRHRGKRDVDHRIERDHEDSGRADPPAHARILRSTTTVPDVLGWSILVAGALIGSVVAGVAGFGAGVILLPLIALTLGIRAAAPVLTVAMLLGNLSRIWWNRAYIATESVCALALHVTRGAVFTRYALLGADAVKVGLVLGAVMFGGAWIGRRLLDRMSDRVFLAVIEALLVVMGLQFLLLPR